MFGYVLFMSSRVLSEELLDTFGNTGQAYTYLMSTRIDSNPRL